MSPKAQELLTHIIKTRTQWDHTFYASGFNEEVRELVEAGFVCNLTPGTNFKLYRLSEDRGKVAWLMLK